MRIPGWMFAMGVVVLIMLTIVLSVVAYGVARQLAIDLPPNDIDFTAFIAPQATSAPLAIPTLAPVTATIEPVDSVVVASPTPVPVESTPDIESGIPLWDDPRRVTILLMGIDQRSAVNEPGPFRTDTMILLNIDPVRKTAGMISLPRDLWVEIPGFEPNRINTANLLGDANAYPGGGGPALAAKTVSTNFGIHVEKYISINFQVFTTLVETIAPGGVEICITETIDDPDYPNAGYGIIHVHFDPGCQRLTAEELLQYARTRATSGADFDRARRQQEVLIALRNEALSLGGITNLAAHAPALWDELADSYRTNLTLEELLALGGLMGEIDGEDIRSGVVDNRYVDLGTTPAGDQVLIPRASSVSFLFQQILNPHDIPDLAELRSRAQAEQASIVVFNNTSIVGLAGNTQEWLISQGVTITGINSVQNGTNAPTQIRDNTNNHWTARYLAALMGIPPERILPGVDGLTTEDVLVLVGDDILPLLNGETDSITGS